MIEWEYAILMEIRPVGVKDLTTRVFQADGIKGKTRKNMDKINEVEQAILEDLNTLGMLGWELVSISDTLGMDQQTFYLKRPK